MKYYYVTKNGEEIKGAPRWRTLLMAKSCMKIEMEEDNRIWNRLTGYSRMTIENDELSGTVVHKVKGLSELKKVDFYRVLSKIETA